MHDYRRILALLDASGADARVARRAVELARTSGAQLAILHWLPAGAPAQDGGPIGRRPPDEAAARRRLLRLARQLNAADATLLWPPAPAGQGLAAVVADWRPDLIVTARDPGCLAGRHDLLTLGAGGRRLVRWLKDLAGQIGGRYAY